MRNFMAMCLTPDFAQVVLVAFLIQLFALLLRYLTKIRGLGDGVEQAVRWATHFDCLRFGVDLALLGLVSLMAIFELALHRARGSQVQDLVSGERIAILFQLSLLVAATLFTAIFDSPEKSRWRGIVVPNLFGWFSWVLSIMCFFYFYNLTEPHS